ncbi:MAG: transketolase [Candidatus Vecturithrix sp.]|jgi:transketolase|nr:transketolase [Candidatus Vecturithrix sp.]
MAALYGYALEYDTEQRDHPDRDRVILSNGHTCAVWYAALARTGFIPLAELNTFRKLGSRLQGHPARKTMPDLIETSTGPLGQGFSVANGIALAMKARNSQGKVYCILGDGEMQEGQVWEALLTAAHYHLDNLIVFVNYNNLQIDGKVSEIMNLAPLAPRLEAFGWNVSGIDGHALEEITTTLKAASTPRGMPSIIIGHTLMGKGVPFMENDAIWHGNCPSDSQAAAALEAIGTSELYEDFVIEQEGVS